MSAVCTRCYHVFLTGTHFCESCRDRELQALQAELAKAEAEVVRVRVQRDGLHLSLGPLPAYAPWNGQFESDNARLNASAAAWGVRTRLDAIFQEIAQEQETCEHIHQEVTTNPDGTSFSTCLKCGAVDQ